MDKTIDCTPNELRTIERVYFEMLRVKREMEGMVSLVGSLLPQDTSTPTPRPPTDPYTGRPFRTRVEKTRR